MLFYDGFRYYLVAYIAQYKDLHETKSTKKIDICGTRPYRQLPFDLQFHKYLIIITDTLYNPVTNRYITKSKFKFLYYSQF